MPDDRSYIQTRQVRFARVDHPDGHVRRRAVIITYRGLVLIGLVIVALAAPAVGYLYARYRGYGRRLAEERAAAEQARIRLRRVVDQQMEILDRLPPAVEGAETGVVSVDDFIRRYGEAARLYLRLDEAFRTAEFEAALALADELAAVEGLTERMDRHLRRKRAWSLFYLDRRDEALAAIDDALAAHPDLHALRHLRAQILMISGRPGAARAAVAAVMDEAPQPDVLFTRATLRWEAGEIDAAVRDYRGVLASGTPRLALAAASNLALLYARDKQDFTRARFHATMLMALAPEGFTSLRTTGKVLLYQGRVRQAVELLEQARRKIADNPDVLVALAVAYRMLGEDAFADERLAAARAATETADALRDRLLEEIRAVRPQAPDGRDGAASGDDGGTPPNAPPVTE